MLLQLLFLVIAFVIALVIFFAAATAAASAPRRAPAAVVALSAVVPRARGTIATHVLPGDDGLLRGYCARWP